MFCDWLEADGGIYWKRQIERLHGNCNGKSNARNNDIETKGKERRKRNKKAVR